MSNKKPTLTFEEALLVYFGGLRKLNKSSLPFRCTCKVEVMTLQECFDHIRQQHTERIANPRRKKFKIDQFSI